ncbi:MAG TPA: helicase C-terminal domain-containing protein [Gemmatimonadaceae bacterium]|nr:helicase C-terminal domain-containing protein [Gemmatimonadaceae bacterium]
MIAFPEAAVADSAQLDPESVAHDLGPDGPIAAAMVQYEDRPAQREMASAIAELYNDGGVGLIEAGTGVGKSLGYLLPALRWAHLTGERTVVSTNTINLQEQLVKKDLPFLEKALIDEQPVRFALLKGWRNYLCLLRLEQANLIGPTLLDDASTGLNAISSWSKATDEGSLSDLGFQPSPDVWDEVAAEPDLCTRTKCPHFDRCFFFRARKEAAAAQVVVANHHLLMSDVAVRRMQQNWDEAAVIPAYTRLVIDEGHHLEDAAAAHLGENASRRGMLRLLSRLARNPGRRGGGGGILAALGERLRARPNDMFSSASLKLLDEKILPAVESCRDKGTVVFDLLEIFLRESGQQVVRLTEDFETHHIWKSGLGASLSDLLTSAATLADTIGMIRHRLELEETPDEPTAALVSELRGVGRRLEALAGALHGALEAGSDAHKRVRWVESRGRGEGNIGVTWVPLDLAPILRDDLFSRVKTTIVTSATLSTDSRFEFLSGRLGVDQLRIPPVTESYASPFNFNRQAILAVPTDVPAPNADPAGHFKAVIRMVTEFTAASDGGIFVLFTSHRDVRQAASDLRALGMAHDRPLLVHGEESRDALLTRFRGSGRAVLLGTSSYWEGVDVAGSALRGLLIARLPFRVPTEPLTAAHCEAIAERGGDPFAEYMVPHAALRLKQGFGRLIRSKTDRGAIVIADPRVVSKSYGTTLMRALPPARRILSGWDEISRQLRDFYMVSE